MPNKNYQRGRAYEYKEKKMWEEDGYFVIRSAGSHSLYDLLAINLSRLRIVGIQVKSGRERPVVECNEKTRKIRNALLLLGIKESLIWYKRIKGKRKVERVLI